MALLQGSNSTELLDLLFDQSNGILTKDSYLTDDFIDQQYSDPSKSTDFGFTDCEADELLNCLNEADLLSGIFQSDCVEPIVPTFDGACISTSTVSHCPEDHIYSRSPDENCAAAPLDVSVASPSTGSAVSVYSCSDAGSPGGTTATDDCYSSSPVSFGMDGEHSPLGGNIEDMRFSVGVSASCGSTVYVVQGTQVIEAVAQEGLNGLPDNNGLVSVDMIETDVESYSDDDSTGAGLDSMNDDLLFDDISLLSNSSGAALPFTLHDVGGRGKKKSQQHHKLVLTEEEKLLLSREGISIPTDVPLTKEEERALKSVRRKIRNKVSAKVSRKRKQEYVEGLEKRVKMCTMQNRQLQQKVEKLEKLNQTFMMQMKKLQAMIAVPNCVNARHAQTGTCIMVLVLSFAFFILPNVGPWLGTGQSPLPQASKAVGPGRSRTLLMNDPMLFSAHPTHDDDTYTDIKSDPSAPNFTPAATNPFLASQNTDDFASKASAEFERKEFVNASWSGVHSPGDLADLTGVPDSAFATNRDEGDVAESLVDVSKLPRKNDL